MIGGWPLALLSALLAPLLLLQARHTRAVTPRLPEPQGTRSGRVGEGSMRPRLRLLIAGDSAAAGVGVLDQREALAGLLTEALAHRFDLDWQLIARTGYDTRKLIARLQLEPPPPFDVAVLSLGVNDVTGALRVGQWLQAQRELIELLCGRHEVKRVLISAVPPIGRFTALPQPLRGLLGLRAREFNLALRRTLSTWNYGDRCAWVGLPTLDQPDAMAEDGFHPGPAAYRVWAAAITRAIEDWDQH